MKKIIITALALTISSAFAQVIPKVDDGKGMTVEALDFQNDPVLKRIKNTKTFTIAVRKSSGPFSQGNAKDGYSGIAVNYCNETANYLKKFIPDMQVKYVEVDSKTRIPTIKEGNSDIECGSTTNNEKRREEVDFTIPYFVAGIKAMALKSNKILNLDSMDGKTIIYTKGTTTKDVAEKAFWNLRNVTVKTVNGEDHADSFKLLTEGKGDVFINDDVLLYSLAQKSGHFADYKFLDVSLSVEPYGLMTQKNTALTSIANYVIRKTMKNGEYDKMWIENFGAKSKGKIMEDYLRICNKDVSMQVCGIVPL
jgi:glutamate/aspartate transport system substrate-binding protein